MTVSAAENAETGEAVLSAQDALDRVAMEAHVRTRLSDLLTPGSTMIVTDRGISNETLRGTDLIVETK
jgi:hypothetical protein